MRSVVLTAFLLAASHPGRLWAQEPAPPAHTALVVGREYAGSLGRGQVASYTLDVQARHFVAGVVQQQSVDVVITVHGPDGKLVGSFDGPARGPEPFQFSSEEAGRHRVEVRPFEQEQGQFALTVSRVEPRATTPEGKVDQLMAAYRGNDSPGAAIIVVRGGRVVLSKAYGMANLEHGVPITPATVFDMASVAKQFTGMAIAILHEQGALSLDDDVRKHLPYLRGLGREVTLRQLLHHTGGLRDWIGALGIAGVRNEDVITDADVLEMARRQRGLNFVPGTEMQYTNTGYFLLAKVVEAVTGQPFATWTRNHIFAPLGMANTSFAVDYRTVIPKRAQSYSVGPGGQFRNVADNLAVVGSSSLYSSTEDMSRWLMNFGRPSVGGGNVHLRMQERGVLAGGDTTNYAFGIEVDRHRGLKRLSHSGSWAGFGSFLAYYPEIDAGLVVVSNLSTFQPWQTTADVAEILFGSSMTPQAPAQPGAARPAASAAPWSPGVAELAAYAGEFFSPESHAVYTLAVRDGKLVAAHPRNGEITLTPKARDVFEANRPYFARAEFQRDGQGKVSGILVSAGRLRNVRFQRMNPP